MFRLDQDGEIARLTLERPEARNAIPLAGWDELGARLEEVARSPARILVLSGAGGTFCAGADLKDFPALNRDAALRTRFRTGMGAGLDRLAGLPIPTIARIEGACYGAGVALAMACDLRLASETARFAITPAKLGISYPQQDVHRLVSLVGPGQAARLLLTAASIDAAEAARIGLVELCGAHEAPLLDAILANAPESLAALKRAIRLECATDAGQDE
ncbi:MAG: enoyl-CoA hydratase/isomerase family protein, partial [Sphingosinicella sp.]|uniref:enoyl-CoA hydratase/isomerase family protein n=1 Tax=Sphingosinicella sp. TaxID=1917971 RepID=UPI004037B9E6